MIALVIHGGYFLDVWEIIQNYVYSVVYHVILYVLCIMTDDDMWKTGSLQVVSRIYI